MEQRNGRIDRTLQPAEEVRCHYFVYPAARRGRRAREAGAEDRHRPAELGSLGAVVLERIERALSKGIDRPRRAAIDEAGSRRRDHHASSWRASASTPPPLSAEIDEARRILTRSRQVMDFREELLHDAIDVGLEIAVALAGAAPRETIEASKPSAAALPRELGCTPRQPASAPPPRRG